MKYRETGTKIDIGLLTAEEKEFYKEAVRKFRRNIDWLDFDEFAFGMRSPIYRNEKSHLSVIRKPLYVALKEMWLQLGVRQGMVRDDEHKGKKSIRERWKTRGSRETAHQRYGQEDGDLALAHSPADANPPTRSRGKHHRHELD